MPVVLPSIKMINKPSQVRQGNHRQWHQVGQNQDEMVEGARKEWNQETENNSDFHS